ncbi:uncharacterized protein LOC143352515 isoform X2 [Halictus rubicundus]|uniref:uncharacterized protein LOC143352515 isoform X2 n=1 Tax=Halictus rubicundus TaxID=77578 RepID=UPI004035D821
MASDLSSGCTEAIEVLDEKEEGEISLEDVSSSEEGHLNYGYGSRAAQCTNCLSTQHNAAWCTAPAKLYHSRSSNRRDAVQGKENRHQIKDSGSIGSKHTVSTLQEKNDDLVPISSDSDMEIVGLADNSKQIVIRSSTKSRGKKKKKKKRGHMSMLTMDDLVSLSTDDVALPECVSTLKHDIKTSPSRSYRREMSPVHRTNRSRVTSRSPPRRHRPITQPHSPFRRSKSPVVHARSATIVRSPRRLKSPKRSPYKSPPGKTLLRKTSHLDPMSSSHNYADTHKLLKKVRHLESIGSDSLEETLYKNRENASSLKKKLSHMMKRVCDNNSDMTSASSTQISMPELNDADDEEDLALLRQKALETKQKKSSKQIEKIKTETVKKISIDDDQDEEDLELRMIALRSAVLKKHQNRLQKGMKSGRYKKSNASRSESPFTQSFLDSIPIPGEELLSIASPPLTPLPMMENDHTEDMDLDTDVEREKEKLPYSPTDKITANIPIDTELLGIQPSDVSFINLNETTNSPSFNTALPSSQEGQKSYQEKIIQNRSYLPNVTFYNPPQNAFYASPSSSMQYSPVHDPRTNILNRNNSTSILETNLNLERPYSPTDAPIYDPDLSQTLPQTLVPINTSASSLPSLGSSYILKSHENNEPCSSSHGPTVEEHLVKIGTLSIHPNVGSAATSQQGSVSPASMITIDDLPEADVDASHMAGFAKSIKCEEDIPAGATDGVKEPLYMKGIPDVTKDANKIPTLINRTLVPASILKTNKQLQQPLQTKKTAAPQEPTFKSAEMQPVTLPEDIKANTSFKPMKLMPIPQKSSAVLAIPTVFHDSLQEDPAEEQPANEDGSSSLGNNNNNAISVQSNVTAESPDKTCDIKSQKKRRRGAKRKSAGALQSKAGTNNDNIDILDKRLSDASELEKRKDIENNTDQSNLEAPKDSVLESRISLETNESEAKGKDALSSDTADQAKDVDRRQSLDEDEEALRAILLASLPKRAKASNNRSHSNSITNASAASDSTGQTVATQIAPANAVSAANSTTSPSPASSYGSENDRNQPNSSEKENEVAAQVGLPVENVKVPPMANSGRKRLVPMTKGPPTKHTKRIPIPASTKVVKNAKKYQNAMIQKKLNVQKAVMQYSKQKVTESKVAAKAQTNDTKWPKIAKTVSDTQRIVINLESDTESDSESERRMKKIALAEKQLAVNHMAEFEKNLDQFLRTVRKKQESMAAARPTPLSQAPKKDAALTTKLENASNLHTPLAVRHLPASRQEEYRRLKQEILEREKLKLHRTAETINSLKNKTVEAISKPVPSNSPGKEPITKINQILSAKSPDLSTQQPNKEDGSKNLDSVKNANNNKAPGADRQETASPNRTKTVSNTMTNLNICITNENGSNNISSKVGSPSQSVTAPRKVFETQNEISVKQRLSPGLKILSTDEVNKKFVQVSVQCDMKERLVTIGDRVTVNNTETMIKLNENVSGSKEVDHNRVPKQVVQSVEKETVANNDISENNDVESDVSTVVLNGRNVTRDSVDLCESTLRLSQLEETSRLSTSPAKSKDDGSPLFRSNVLSNDKRSIEENWDTIKRDAKTELNALIALPREEQEQHLLDTEQKLVLKRYTILEDLAEMSGNLRQWNMERDLQTNLVAEVKMLREQLKVAEERLQMQRNRINSIGPKVVTAHGKVNVGRQECFKLATICSSLGSRIIGKEYKVPEAAAQLVENKLKEVANHTRQLSRKKVPSISLPEAYDSVSSVHSDVSQTEDLLSVQCGVDNLDNVDNTDEMKEIETRDNVPEETPATDVREVDDQEEQKIIITDSTISNNVESVPQQSNTEEIEEDQKTFVDQPDSISVPVTDIPVSKESEEPSQKDSPNDSPKEPTVKLEPASESCSHDRTSPKPDVDRLTRKAIVPYESILLHFKVPRNTNPNGVLCPYELMGTCNDGECQYVHQRENEAK